MACLLGQNTKFNTLGSDSLHQYKQQELRGSPAAKRIPTETSLKVPQGALVLSGSNHVPGNERRHMASTGEGFPLLCRWLQVGFSEVAARLVCVRKRLLSGTVCPWNRSLQKWEGISILGGFQNLSRQGQSQSLSW